MYLRKSILLQRVYLRKSILVRLLQREYLRTSPVSQESTITYQTERERERERERESFIRNNRKREKTVSEESNIK